MSGDQDFNNRLLEVFWVEAREHRQAILTVLQELDRGAGPERRAEMAAKAFRAAHTLKGAARAVNKGQIAVLSQSLEGIFHRLMSGQGQLAKEMFGALFEAVDRIEKMEARAGDGDPELSGRLNDILGSLDG
jgi:two-component system, chemotaxis family, sensor kinase CheA